MVHLETYIKWNRDFNKGGQSTNSDEAGTCYCGKLLSVFDTNLPLLLLCLVFTYRQTYVYVVHVEHMYQDIRWGCCFNIAERLLWVIIVFIVLIFVWNFWNVWSYFRDVWKWMKVEKVVWNWMKFESWMNTASDCKFDVCGFGGEKNYLYFVILLTRQSEVRRVYLQ